MELMFEIKQGVEKAIPGREEAGPKRILKGFVSTEDLDWQGQQMVQQGINYQYLKQGSARANWDHQNSLIIGEPIYVEMLPEGLWLETQLYQPKEGVRYNSQIAKSLEKAQWAWDYQKMVESNGGKPLSYSIQGPPPMMVGNKIVKSLVTAYAITDRPVNTACSVQAFCKSWGAYVNAALRLSIQDIKDPQSLISFLGDHGISPEESTVLVDSILKMANP